MARVRMEVDGDRSISVVWVNSRDLPKNFFEVIRRVGFNPINVFATEGESKFKMEVQAVYNPLSTPTTHHPRTTNTSK